jgi:acetylornithine deacetylase/succinyl-diaminopimelate desuccinylase family protein
MKLNELEKKILHNVNVEDATELTRELVRIPSPNPPGDTREITHFLQETLQKRGLHGVLYRVEKKHVSLVVRIEGIGGGKSLLLNAHIDTVPIGDRANWTLDPFGAEIKNGKMFGRGSTDCKSGVAAIIIAADAVNRAGVQLRGDVILAMVAGEETLSDKGTGYLLQKELIHGDAAIVTEPTTLPSEDLSDQPLQIFTSGRGLAWLEITVEGKAAHAKVTHLGVNAIEKMAKIVLALQNIEFPRHLRHPLSGMPTLNVGVIEGGTSPSIVPDRCQIILDRNIVPGENSATVIEQITEVINRLKKEDSSLKATIKTLKAEDPVEISQNEQLVKVLNQSITAGLGVEAKIGGMIGTNDSRFLIRKGIPTVVCGPGTTTQSHNRDEYVEVESIANAAKAYALTMARFCA